MKKIALIILLAFLPALAFAQGNEPCYLKKGGIYAATSENLDAAINAMDNNDKKLLEQLISDGSVGLAPQKTEVQRVAAYPYGKVEVIVPGSSEQVWSHMRFLDCPWVNPQ